jgi:hypothetical protein
MMLIFVESDFDVHVSWLALSVECNPERIEKFRRRMESALDLKY